MSETLSAAVREAVADAREQETKAATLHEARAVAHAEMRQPIGQHEFLVSATREADKRLGDLRHRVNTLVRQQAYVTGVQLVLGGPTLVRRGGNGPIQPLWDDVSLYTPEWYRRFKAWHLETYPESDAVTRANLDMLIEAAESRV